MCEIYFCFSRIFNLQNKELCYYNVRIIMDAKLNAVCTALATNALLFQVQSLKLAASPHFEINIDFRVM
jgi:hypothetical protein